MKSARFRCVALVLALLLLSTGGLKIHAAFSDQPTESYLLTSRWELLAIAEFEFLLGGWLLSGMYSRLARRCALMTFLCFLAVSLAAALSGERSCSCFGKLEVSPWTAAFIDMAALSALLLCRPRTNTSTVPLYPIWRSLIVAFALMLLALPIALAMNGDARPPLLIPSKPVVDLGILSAGEWREASLCLTNETDMPVEIATIESSCHCLSMKFIPQVVPPSGKAEMIVTLDLGKEPSFAGNLRIRARGRTRSGALAFSVQVTAKVQKPQFLPQLRNNAMAR